MPNFSIVDTHLHLWDRDRFHYDWIGGIPKLNRSFLLNDFNDHSKGVNVDQMVFVQCDCRDSESLDEAKWIADLAENDPRISGIVAFAPIEKSAEIRGYLDELIKIPKVKGVRRLLHVLDDDDFCVQTNFIDGVKMLAEFDLSFDICAKHTQLPNVIRMIDQCPEVNFMLDHIGNPNIKENVFESWSNSIAKISKFENVFCKISGVATAADHENWTIDDLRPFVEFAIESFGWARVAYGGDWPVSILATRYPIWIETLNEIVKSNTTQQQKNLFRENAIRFYRLSEA